MRSALTLSILLVPGLAAAQTMCAATPAGAQTPPAATAPAVSMPPRISEAEIKASPALSRLSSRGAELYDLGISHGLRGVFAKHQNQFRIIHLTPDGQAGVEGVLRDLITGDPGKRNITLAQVRGIPGVLPTVDMRGQAAGQQQPAVSDTEAMAAIESSAFGLVGQEGAPRLYMLMDPLCPHSVNAFAQLRPAIDAGKVQVAVIPTAIFAPDRSRAIAALLLTDHDRARIGEAWREATEAARRREQPPVAPSSAFADLDRNMAVAATIGAPSVPILAWRDRAGAPQAYIGEGGTQTILASLGVE